MEDKSYWLVEFGETRKQPDTAIIDERYRGYYLRSKFGRDEYIAWACKDPLNANSPISEKQHKAVYFDLGKTREEALAKIRREIDKLLG